MASTASSTTPASQAPPAGVDGGEDPLGAAEGDRGAVGGRGRPGRSAGPAVTRASARRRRRWPAPDPVAGRPRPRCAPWTWRHPLRAARPPGQDAPMADGDGAARRPVRGRQVAGRHVAVRASDHAARTVTGGATVPRVRRARVSEGTRGRRSRRRPGRGRRRSGVAKMSSWARLQAEHPAAALLAARPTRRRLGAGPALALPALEAGGDDGDPHLVAHVLVDDAAEDDVGVGVGHAVDDLGRLVDLEQPEVGPAGDVEQDAPGPLDGGLEQRAGDGGPGGVDRPALAGRRADAHDGGAGVAHDHLHVGEVGVDEARAR